MIVRALFLLLLVLKPITATPSTLDRIERIKSTVLGEEREYQVHLPDSYRWAQDRRYPVLYVLDGQTHFFHSAGSVSFLAAEGELPEMIVVALASTVRIRDFTQKSNFAERLAKQLGTASGEAMAGLLSQMRLR